MCSINTVSFEVERVKPISVAVEMEVDGLITPVVKFHVEEALTVDGVNEIVGIILVFKDTLSDKT